MKHSTSATPVTPRSREKWFLTSKRSRVDRPDGANVLPVGPTHVKLLGTGKTACGLSTDSWITFWELRITDEMLESCAACRAKVLTDPVHGSGRAR